MGAWELLKEIRDQWPEDNTTRWIIVGAVFLGCGFGFGASTFWWSGTVSALRERLSFSQDKLQVALANPTNPGAALLTKTTGRHLSDRDKDCIIRNFKDKNDELPKTVVVTVFPDEEARSYGTEFVTVFIRLGFASGLIEGGPKHYGDTGLMIGLSDPDHPSEQAAKFIALMSKCELLTNPPIKWEVPPVLQPALGPYEFDLFVGPRN